MTRIPRALLLLFLTALGLVGLAPSQAMAGFSSECPFGVNAHQASDGELDFAAAAGIGWVRMDFNWEQFEPSRGTYDWTVPDRFVARAEALELNVFATVAYTPDWAVSGSCDNAASEASEWCRNAVPASTSDWTDFITAAVGRYGDRIKHWGMWNEPNLEHFFRGTSAEYVDVILEPGSTAVHDACGDCFVLGPELAHMRGSDSWNGEEGVCAFGECIFNGWEVSLTEILQESGSSIDIITHHNYEGSSSDMWAELADGQFLIIQYMHGVKEITDSYAPGKPVWLTEFGYESTPGGEFSEAEAARELEESFEDFFDVQAGSHASVANQPWPEVEKLFWYDLTDDPTTYDWGTFTWGLLEADHTPKEAWYTYADVISASGGCWEKETETEDPAPDTGQDPAPDTGQDPAPDTGDPASDEDANNSDRDPYSTGDAVDTGSDGAADATTPTSGANGCGCSTGGSLTWMALLPLLPLVVRRRARMLNGSVAR
jgi:hypothetical protein